MKEIVKRIVILISGRGSNMQSIVEACRAEHWPAEVAAVISNRSDAPGLETARRFGIATETVDHTRFATRAAFDAALAERIDAYAPDLVALAGFMRVLGPQFVHRYAGRMLNIHPSLLPLFPGLHTHRAALAAGAKQHGATVHLVTDDLDHGPVLAQAVVPVLPDDNEESLANRVLEREHVIYPRAIREFLEQLPGDTDAFHAGALAAPPPSSGASAPGAEPLGGPDAPAQRSKHAVALSGFAV